MGDSRRSGGPAASGTGLAHFEANWGSTFPAGWVWAQAVLDTETQLLLTGGNFTIAGATRLQWVVSFRSPQAGALDYRTIDLDRFATASDCRAGTFAINASRPVAGGPELLITLQTDPASFSAPLGVRDTEEKENKNKNKK